MAYHPHLHVIMPGVVLSEDGLSLRRAKGTKYLFPVKALGAAFRHRLMKLILARDQAKATRHLSQIDPYVWRIPWVVDSRGVGYGQAAVRYLARDDSVASSGSLTPPLRCGAVAVLQSVSRLPPPLGCQQDRIE